MKHGTQHLVDKAAVTICEMDAIPLKQTEGSSVTWARKGLGK